MSVPTVSASPGIRKRKQCARDRGGRTSSIRSRFRQKQMQLVRAHVAVTQSDRAMIHPPLVRFPTGSSTMMYKSHFLRLGALAAGMLLAAAAVAQNKPAAPAASTAAASAAAPAVAEPADRLIKEMGAYIGSAQEFTFHADVTFDHVLPSGQKLLFSAAEEVMLQRPGRLYVEWNGDLGARQFWYDGKSVTLFDPAMPFCASEAAPPEIDSMLEQLLPKLDFVPPLSDFLYRDPYKSVRGNIEYGFAKWSRTLREATGVRRPFRFRHQSSCDGLIRPMLRPSNRT